MKQTNTAAGSIPNSFLTIKKLVIKNMIPSPTQNHATMTGLPFPST